MTESYHRRQYYSLDETLKGFRKSPEVEQMTSASQARASDIKGMILDYGEVLCLRPAEEQIRRMASVFGISPSQFATLYEKNRRAYDRGDLTPERYWFSFADEPGIGLAADQISVLRAWDVEMWSNANPVMIEWLEAMHFSGFGTALLSNMHADMVAKARREFYWIRLLDCAVFSHEVNLAKPEVKIYEHCLKGLGTAAYETLFIDDREPNVKAAQTLGIRAIRFESVAQLRAELEKLDFPILPESAPASKRCG
jgi:putative hydrolase of the HAD superfamily